MFLSVCLRTQAPMFPRKRCYLQQALSLLVPELSLPSPNRVVPRPAFPDSSESLGSFLQQGKVFDFIEKFSTLAISSAYLAMARNISLTLLAFLADVSMKSKPFSSAYALASSYSTSLLLPKSDLLPAKAITMLGLACLCNSLTQLLALVNVSCKVFLCVK